MFIASSEQLKKQILGIFKYSEKGWEVYFSVLGLNQHIRHSSCTGTRSGLDICSNPFCSRLLFTDISLSLYLSAAISLVMFKSVRTAFSGLQAAAEAPSSAGCTCLSALLLLSSSCVSSCVCVCVCVGVHRSLWPWN